MKYFNYLFIILCFAIFSNNIWKLDNKHDNDIHLEQYSWSEEEKDIFILDLLIGLQTVSYQYNNNYLSDLHYMWLYMHENIMVWLESKQYTFDFSYKVYVQPFINATKYPTREELNYLVNVSSSLFLNPLREYENINCKRENPCQWTEEMIVSVYNLILTNHEEEKRQCDLTRLNENIRNIYKQKFGNTFEDSYGSAFFNPEKEIKLIQYACIGDV